MNKSIFFKYISVFAFCLLPVFAVKAQKVESVHKDWTVLSTVINSEKVCYIASLPEMQEGNLAGRQDTYLLVNLFSDRKAEISFVPGFALNENKVVKFSINDVEYDLAKIKDNIAWARTAKQDEELIEAMKKNMNLHIRSEGEKGDYAIDTYSLSGFTAAYDEMVALCNESEEAVNQENEEEVSEEEEAESDKE